MWERGVLVFDDVEVIFGVKYYDIRSCYVIEGGRVSKLWMEVKGKTIVNYDRGWDIHPKGRLAKRALKEVLKLYN
jgi:hypothetical protein